MPDTSSRLAAITSLGLGSEEGTAKREHEEALRRFNNAKRRKEEEEHAEQDAERRFNRDADAERESAWQQEYVAQLLEERTSEMFPPAFD